MKSRQGQLLKRILRTEKITQAELARRLGLSPTHICKVVKGERELGKDKMREASKLLGIPMESFFQ
jgi:transcriptional regulator with XRE-family HTH domain